MRTKKVQSAGGIVINKKGQVAVVSQGGNSWSLPKGHVDSGEDVFTTAKREIWEETGIEEKDLIFIKELGSYQRYKGEIDENNLDKSEFKNINMFLFKTEKEELKPLDQHNPEAVWLNVEDVPQKLSFPKDINFFLSVKDQLKINE